MQPCLTILFLLLALATPTLAYVPLRAFARLNVGNNNVARRLAYGNTFGVQAADGAPRTKFHPTDGINYWNKQ